MEYSMLPILALLHRVSPNTHIIRVQIFRVFPVMLEDKTVQFTGDYMLSLVMMVVSQRVLAENIKRLQSDIRPQSTEVIVQLD